MRINKTPGVCGGDACVGDSRIAVWSLEQWRRMGFDDDSILECHPELDQSGLDASREYAEAHPEEIAEALRLNVGA